MRIITDLLACQMGNSKRGIGRYTLSVFEKLAKIIENNELFVLANRNYEEQFEFLRQRFIRLVPRGHFLPYFHEPILYGSNSKNTTILENIAESLVLQAYNLLNPDFVLTPSFFEGWKEKGVVPTPIFPTSYKKAAIVYDLIPFIFSNQYLDKNQDYKTWYLNKIDSVKKFDLLFAISESTRNDFINLLGIHPQKIFNISGGVDPGFKKIFLSNEEMKEIKSKFGIVKPFIFFLGGNDYRKNVDQLIRAYSSLPVELISTYQIVVNDVANEIEFKNKVRKLGLSEKDVIITGRITDSDLVKIYNMCELFVFPSLYEGFGLPILEAMACGSPVIAANNSSLIEIVGRNDALFETNSDEDITRAIHKALTFPDFRNDLREYGINRAKQFTWENSAKKILDTITHVHVEEIEKDKTRLFYFQKIEQKRIAFVSPLPPQKSGISDYSAELLPYLDEYFDIDIFVDQPIENINPAFTSQFSIYPWQHLLKNKSNYESVIYQMGNSIFHSFMLDLIRKVPGIVVLHDFYIGNLISQIMNPHKLILKLDNDHGLRSLLDLQSSIEKTILKWPMNWSIMKFAKEIIVHSKFQKELNQKYYHLGWSQNPSIINPLRSNDSCHQTKPIEIIKENLEIPKEKFIFCVFGIISPFKYIKEIIEAFYKLTKNNDDSLLLFIGEFVNKDFEHEIHNLVKKLKLKTKIRFTGFVTPEQYRDYLICVDIAIQLRKNSRGETSAAVLDCLESGIPTIVNAHGSLKELEKEAVVMLPEFFSIDLLSEEMNHLFSNKSLQNRIRENSQMLIKRDHNPFMIAKQYAQIIHKVILSNDKTIFKPIIENHDYFENVELFLKNQAKFATKNFANRSQPRILVDVSHISSYDYETGIQRVVKNLVHEFLLMDDPSLKVEPVRLIENRFLKAFRFSEKLFNLNEGSLGLEIPVNIMPGDSMLMLDSTWIDYKHFLPLFNQIRMNGGKIITMVYDLIPINFPEFSDSSMTNIHKNWLNMAIDQSDILVCISKTVANEVQAYITKSEISVPHKQDIVHIHLGSDIKPIQNKSIQKNIVVQKIVNSNEPFFIMVGTLEPRKGHVTVLDAFDILWNMGSDLKLIILGKIGWNVADLEKRIRNHEKLNKYLFFIENASDMDIELCYSNAIALIAASWVEGFGLPIVEAAIHDTPVIARDIPVFREIGLDGVTYFNSVADLSNIIKTIIELSNEERTNNASKISRITWKESAEWLLNIIENNY